MAKKVEIEQKEIDAPWSVSGVEPYELPEGWKWQTACDIADIYTGNSINEKVKSEKYEGQPEGLNFIGTKDIDFDGSINYTNGVKINDFENFKTAPANTPLLCIEGGSSGKKLGFTNEQVCFGNKLCAFVCKEVEPKLVYYYLQSNFFFHSFMKERHGLIGGVSVGSIKQIPFPLPPTLAEQQRIVNRIESMFAKLDEAKEKAQNVVDSFEPRKAAILHQAFTGNLTAKWRKENGVSDDSWEEKTIGEICLVKGGKRVPKGMSLIKEQNDHPYLKAGNLKEGTVLDKDMEFIPDDVLQIIKNYTVKAGDIYITNVGACIGDCGIIPPKYDGANLTENAVKLTDFNCCNKYLAQQLASNIVQQQIKSKIQSATLGKLSIDNIKSLKVNISSLTEQKEIVRILDIVLEKERIAKSAAEQVLEQIDLLKKSILARAFRGEL